MNSSFKKHAYFIYCRSTIRRVPITGFYLYHLYLHFGFCLLVFIPSGILNVFVAVAILRRKSLMILPNLLIVNILFGNFIFAFIIPIWSLNFVLASFGKQNCTLYFVTVSSLYTCSLIAVFETWLISAERYCSIYQPWNYSRKVALLKKFFLRFALLLWIFSIIIGGTSCLSPQFMVTNMILTAIIPCSIIASIVVHFKIYCTTSSVINRIQKFSAQSYHENVQNKQRASKTNYTNQDRRLTIITACTVLQLIICYLPFCVVVIYKTFIKQSDADISTIFTWSITVGALKSVTNPVTFMYQLKTVRKSFKQLLCLHETNER